MCLSFFCFYECSSTSDIDFAFFIGDEKLKGILYFQGKDLQRSLEEALFNRTNRFSFRIADQDYTLNFLPTSDMSQTNVKYGTTRKVRRRPAKGISKDDIRGLKRYVRMWRDGALIRV